MPCAGMMERWNNGMMKYLEGSFFNKDDILLIIFLSIRIPPIQHHCIFPEPIVPSFHHSNIPWPRPGFSFRGIVQLLSRPWPRPGLRGIQLDSGMSRQGGQGGPIGAKPPSSSSSSAAYDSAWTTPTPLPIRWT